MKKTVAVCMLVVILACMWSSVACALTVPTVPSPLYGPNWILSQSGETIYLWATSGQWYKNQLTGFSSTEGIKYYESYNGGQNWTGGAYVDGEYNCASNGVLGGNGIIYTDINLSAIYLDFTPGPVFPFGDVEISIALPWDGYKDNSWLYSVSWVAVIQDVQQDYDVDNLEIKVSLDGQPFGSLYTSVVSNKTYYQGVNWYNYVKVDVEIPIGQHEIQVKYEYNGEPIGSDAVTVERLAGFVDADGDGLDDRTGQPDSSEKPVFDPEPEMPQKPEDGDLLAWMQYVGELLSYIFETIVDAVKEFALSVYDGMRAVLSIAEPMFTFMQQFFSSMPAPMSAAIMALVTVATVLGILKLFRG